MYRIYTERKPGFENEARRIFGEIKNFLGVSSVTGVRYLNRYDIENVDGDACKEAALRIFSEPQSDICYFEHIPLEAGNTVIIWEYLPGQYDQRADSAEQCLSLLLSTLQPTGGAAQAGGTVLTGSATPADAKPSVRAAKMVVLSGDVTPADVEKIQKYLINPVDSRLAKSEIPGTLKMDITQPSDIPVFEGFINLDAAGLEDVREKMGLAMDSADIAFLQAYFKKEGRDPTETEVRVLDTYWSDHCRHTTFNTVLEDVAIDGGELAAPLTASLAEYRAIRDELYGDRVKADNPAHKPLTLMDMACIGAKYLKKHGKLDDIELSEEINACSIYIDVDVDDYTSVDGPAGAAGAGATSAASHAAAPEHRTEKWLLQFKNETHNHPTEIEPFGGAATCIGGAIRDPLSGRAWVYQSLRVTGASDPTVPLSQTREGKLPQKKLTVEAAQGFSSYGNQIGLTTGQVAEMYHPGFEAKRMELGAVIAAVPADCVKREVPDPGDVVILVGGGTGRDGIGGATGSSKAHTVQSVTTAAAEVQKGNAVEERKIQRLFRNRTVDAMIRRCNDFGAGGVSVAVGELAPGLLINLDAVPKKYEGLNGTELAISESQERMALVVREKDAPALVAAAQAENLNAVRIATVTDTNRLVMTWRGKTIVDIDRAFLDTAGASRAAKAHITAPRREDSPLCAPLARVQEVLNRECGCGGVGAGATKVAGAAPASGCDTQGSSALAGAKLHDAWLANLSDLAVCSQRGLGERFDGSIGASTVIFPMGGAYQSTPESGCAAKIPVLAPCETNTASLMTFGYDPRVSSWSPYHGAQTAVLQSLARISALGGRPARCRLTFQEYFERTSSPEAWGKPAAALLGALTAQTALGTASIGGKDSMSGTFADIHVPPTLVSFAVTTEDARAMTSGAFKAAGHTVYYIPCPYKADLTPDFAAFTALSEALYTLTKAGKVAALYPVGAGGIAEAVTKMAFGNRIGFAFDADSYEKVRAAHSVQATALENAGHTCTSWLLFTPFYGSLIVEVAPEYAGGFEAAFAGLASKAGADCGAEGAACGASSASVPFVLGATTGERTIRVKKAVIDLAEAEKAWEAPLASVFPPIAAGRDDPSAVEALPQFALDTHESLAQARAHFAGSELAGTTAGGATKAVPAGNGSAGTTKAVPAGSAAAKAVPAPAAKPKVLVPVFPGTNCEYDMARAFSLAGADPEIFVFCNNTPEALAQSLEQLRKKLGTAQILALSGGFSAGDEPDGSGKFIANVLRESRIADGVMELLETRKGLVLGICNGFQALIKTGLLPYGKIITTPTETMPTLTYNRIGRHISRMVRTRMVSGMSPWAQDATVLDAPTHCIPISHGEGRVVLSEDMAKELFANGQVFTQYVNEFGVPVMTEPDNPNGSLYAIEGMTSPDGRVLGKMGHTERTVGANPDGSSDVLMKNAGENRTQNIFAAGVRYFA